MKKQIALLATLILAFGMSAFAQESKRAIKTPARIVYPELAKRMNVTGAVKVEVVVAPNGTVKTAKAIGGHPLLIESAVTAAKNTKYEPSAEETKELIVYNFNNQ